MTKTMKQSTEEIKSLISIIHGDNEYKSDMARTDLLMEISENYMNKHLSRYRNKMTVGGMDFDDLCQIFLIGCSEAMNMVDTRVGDPLMFIIQKGKWKVVDSLRKSYRGVLRQYCSHCQTETRIDERNSQMICPNCGATGDGIERFQIDNFDDGTIAGTVQDEGLGIPEALASQLIVDEFRHRLTGRKADVFDLIMVNGVDRDSSKNYIKECAAILEVSPANVNLRLRQIKEDWATYMIERDLDAELI